MTGKVITDDNGNPIKSQLKPKEQNNRKLVRLINDIILSISKDNNSILKKEYCDPTDLAQKINGILKNLTFASAKMSLYTFVEIFLFKYLSDIGILTGDNSFEYIYNLYLDKNISDAKMLGKYLDGPRETMKTLFPSGSDGTSIINGQVFHAEKDQFNNYISPNNTDVIFRQVIVEFKKYETAKGKFINISKDFKSKLFETFMKNSDDKADMGQFFTPLKVVSEMINMIDIHEGMKICDPACGVGKFLLEAIENKIDEYFYIDKNKLVKKVELFGYDKMMSENDDITIILAKANMLIYFSKLFKDNNALIDVQNLAQELLNKTFHLSKTMLGTLDNLEPNKYNLILANPPYYQSKAMRTEAKKTGLYTLGGAGVESMFLEWIVKSLDYGGIANVVLPDGIFSKSSNKKLKKYILDNCYIEAIISLPTGTFFNTPKKTYILKIRKKSEYELENEIHQNYPVFSYICSSIGEELNINRFEMPEDNDLHEAVCKYNNYKKIEDKNNIKELFKSYFIKDKRFKAIPIEEFDCNTSWIIENWWNDDEKINIGLKEPKKEITVDEFKQLLENTESTINKVKNELELLKTHHSYKCKNVSLQDIFDFSITSNTNLTKAFVQKHRGKIPVYGSSKNINEVTYGYIKDNIKGIKYFDDCLTINRNGSAGYVFYRKGHFCINEDVTPLILYDKYKDLLDYNFLMYELQKITIEKFSHIKKAGKSFLKNIQLSIPIKEDGTFDIIIQKEISQKYILIQQIKARINEEITSVFSNDIVF